MKRIFCIIFGLFFVAPSVAATCEPMTRTLTYGRSSSTVGPQLITVDAAQYLYDSQSTRDFAYNTANTGVSIPNGGKFFSCNTSKNSTDCGKGTLVFMGKNHVWKNKVISTPQLYECEGSMLNSGAWSKYDLKPCSGNTPKSAPDNTEAVLKIGGKQVRFSALTENKYYIPASDDVCMAYVCKDGYTLDASKKNCVKKTETASGTTETRSGVVNKGKESRAGTSTVDNSSQNEQNKNVTENQEKNTNQEQAQVVKNKTNAGESCSDADLKKTQYATAGVYVKKSDGTLNCAATACTTNTYLVVNNTGQSMGWCFAAAGANCAAGMHLNIIDGTKTDRKCVADVTAASSSVPVTTDTMAMATTTSTTTEDTVEENKGNNVSGSDEQDKSTSGVEIEQSKEGTGGIENDGNTQNIDSEETAQWQDGQGDNNSMDETVTTATDANNQTGEMAEEITAAITGTGGGASGINDKSTNNEAGMSAQTDPMDRVADAEKALDAAKANENSLANRLISGAAIGAGGVGGMMLASGISESSADAAAEIDMAAYLATFRCDYGGGHTSRGGDTDVQLPAVDLFALKNEYTTLAADLKLRKESLGLAPGIESEGLIDAAGTNLYNTESVGRGDGAYVSLSRALMDEDGDVAAAWDAQKSDTTDKMKTGGIVAGAGLGAGLIGNIITTSVQKSNADKDAVAETDAAEEVK